VTEPGLKHGSGAAKKQAQKKGERHPPRWCRTFVILANEEGRKVITIRMGWIIPVGALLLTGLPVEAREKGDGSLRRSLYEGTPPNPVIQAMVDSVSRERIRGYLEKLVGFYTRHTNSDTLSPGRGIGAARRWVRDQFQEFSDRSGGRLRPELFWFEETICGRPARHANVLATLPGTLSEAKERHFIVSGHLDDRTFGVCDDTSFAPGANDDGSGTASSIEAARVMSPFAVDATVIFMAVTGEDQGLFGSRAYARWARAHNLRIDGMLTNDVIGNIIGPTGSVDSLRVRHFSIGPSTSPSRQLARYWKLKGEQYVPGFTVQLIPAQDRPGRGGDHISFNEQGYAAVRFTEPDERLEHQHSNTDVVENMSPAYVAKVTQVTVAGLASLALAPETPTTALEVWDVGNGTDLQVRWTATNREPDFAGYRLAIREPDSLFYSRIVPVGNVTEFTLRGLEPEKPVYLSLSALDQQGNESIFGQEVLATPRRVPLAPQGLDATSKPNGIELRWQANRELDLEGYTLYRRKAGDSDFTVHASLGVGVQDFFDSVAVAPHTFYFYYLRARDQEGQESEPSVVVKGRLATHDRGILIIDGTRDGSGRPLQPTDAEVDDFYDRLLQGFPVAGQWDIADSTAQQLSLSDADMSPYSTVVWNSEVTPTALPIARDSSALKKYLDNGGNLLLIGWNLSTSISGQAGEMKSFPPGSFMRDYLKVASSRTTPASQRDFKGADPRIASYPPLTVDSLKVPLFGANLLSMDTFLSLVEEPRTQVLYTYRSSAIPPSTDHGQPVAVRYLGRDFKVILIDFPLFFMTEDSARAAIQQALRDLGETAVQVKGLGKDAPPARFSLEANYPNPFNVTTRLAYRVARPAVVSLRLYNLLGQAVRTLVDERQEPGRYVRTWDGKTDDGTDAPTGVYLYEMRAGEFVQVRKLLLLR